MLTDSPLLDGLVNRIRLNVGTGNQRHALAACVPLKIRVDHPLARRVMMTDAVDMTVFGKLTRDHQRTLAITRIPQPQCERREIGIAEPVQCVELNRSVCVPDRRAHCAGMPDRRRFMRVTHERQPNTLLDRELVEDLSRLRVDHAGFVDDDPIARAQHVLGSSAVYGARVGINFSHSKPGPHRRAGVVGAPSVAMVRKQGMLSALRQGSDSKYSPVLTYFDAKRLAEWTVNDVLRVVWFAVQGSAFVPALVDLGRRNTYREMSEPLDDVDDRLAWLAQLFQKNWAA